jgi:hypothetical protein
VPHNKLSVSMVPPPGRSQATRHTLCGTICATELPWGPCSPSRPATPLMLSIGDQDKGDVVLTTTVTALLVANIAAFETLKMNEAPAMLLAMDVLKQRRLVLSFGCNKMFAQT